MADPQDPTTPPAPPSGPPGGQIPLGGGDGGNKSHIPSNIEAEQHGDIAVTRANLDIVWSDRPTAYNRYVRVWRRGATGWQVISQATLKASDRKPGKA